MGKTLGELVKEGRKNKNLSLRKLAELSDMNHTDIARIENGLYLPKPDIIRKISRNIDVNYQELMDAAGYKNNINLDNEYLNNIVKEYNDDTIKYGITAFSGIVAFEFFMRMELEKELEKTKDEKQRELLMDTIDDLDYWVKIHGGFRYKFEEAYKKEHLDYITYEDIINTLKDKNK